ncbi:alkene reductase [Conexibacter sp. W3-3-2]|uniref:alkene reductase n=1 Tax=Conexibacter sp. W3-3-2 TaxID=2675227 RepID=UPI0012B6B5C7|nr:alkene reductase [Conexibacter sp. W3-3-2]MTD44703.1 alkene reductase [Conexibacter sp. W3-3-2]
MPHPALTDPFTAGALELAHRVVMAPLTRMRATGAGSTAPKPLNAEYYGQRSSPGGLLISEATQVAPDGQGYPDTPGIHEPEHVAGWRGVTDAVHEHGGLIVAQLWHVGRISHSSFQPGGGPPVAPSAVTPAGRALDASFQPVPFETPRALALDELPGVVERFRAGARNAQEAGFDGVEIHGANGYLLQQFLEPHTNLRDDAYGGSIANRARLLLEVVDAACAVLGSERVGVRLSPYGSANDSYAGTDGTLELYAHVLAELAARDIAYLHLIEPRGHADRPSPSGISSVAALLRPQWPGTLIAAGGFTPTSAAEIVAAGDADAVAFGRAFIANPDLPERIARGAALNDHDRSTFYGGDHRGYTDYPTLTG